MAHVSLKLKEVLDKARKASVNGTNYNSFDYWVLLATDYLVENQKLREENDMVKKRLSELSLKLNVPQQKDGL